MLSLLPRDILQEYVLSLVDLHSLVRFSSCPKQCHKIVFTDTPAERWREIQFCDGVNPCDINDKQLEAFLIKINAKENTHKLSLIGCPNIRGSGIEPLRRSHVLEDLDMRVTGTLPLRGEQGKQFGETGLRHLRVFNVLYSIVEAVDEMSESFQNVMVLRRLVLREQHAFGDRRHLRHEEGHTNSAIRTILNDRHIFWSRWEPPFCHKCKSVRSNNRDRCYLFCKKESSCMAPQCSTFKWCINCRGDAFQPWQDKGTCVSCDSQ
jgi:hypothetical protein